MSIELKNVTKKFGEVAAVNNVTFSVKEGELMALLGPSGGGKTTVLRMIAGLEMPTGGDVFIRGLRVNDLSVQQRNIGFVFQSYALFKHMNVFKNIAFGLQDQEMEGGGHQGSDRGAAQAFRAGRAGAALPAPVVGRPAAARGDCARAGAEAQRAAAGRAVRRGGRQDPPGAARVAGDAASRSERDHHLRHARPGGGDGSGQPDRDILPRRPGAGRHAARSL